VLAGADLRSGARVLVRLKEAIDASSWGRDTPGLNVTLSVGVATRPKGGTMTAAVAAADQALYDAKAAGRNRIVTHSNQG